MNWYDVKYAEQRIWAPILSIGLALSFVFIGWNGLKSVLLSNMSQTTFTNDHISKSWEETNVSGGGGSHFQIQLQSFYFVPMIKFVSLSLNRTWNRIVQVSWIRQKDLHILTVGETSYTNNLKFFPTHPPGR